MDNKKNFLYKKGDNTSRYFRLSKSLAPVPLTKEEVFNSLSTRQPESLKELRSINNNYKRDIYRKKKHSSVNYFDFLKENCSLMKVKNKSKNRVPSEKDESKKTLNNNDVNASKNAFLKCIPIKINVFNNVPKMMNNKIPYISRSFKVIEPLYNNTNFLNLNDKANNLDNIVNSCNTNEINPFQSLKTRSFNNNNLYKSIDTKQSNNTSSNNNFYPYLMKNFNSDIGKNINQIIKNVKFNYHNNNSSINSQNYKINNLKNSNLNRTTNNSNFSDFIKDKAIIDTIKKHSRLSSEEKTNNIPNNKVIEIEDSNNTKKLSPNESISMPCNNLNVNKNKNSTKENKQNKIVSERLLSPGWENWNSNNQLNYFLDKKLNMFNIKKNLFTKKEQELYLKSKIEMMNYKISNSNSKINSNVSVKDLIDENHNNEVNINIKKKTEYSNIVKNRFYDTLRCQKKFYNNNSHFIVSDGGANQNEHLFNGEYDDYTHFLNLNNCNRNQKQEIDTKFMNTITINKSNYYSINIDSILNQRNCRNTFLIEKNDDLNNLCYKEQFLINESLFKKGEIINKLKDYFNENKNKISKDKNKFIFNSKENRNKNENVNKNKNVKKIKSKVKCKSFCFHNNCNIFENKDEIRNIIYRIKTV